MSFFKKSIFFVCFLISIRSFASIDGTIYIETIQGKGIGYPVGYETLGLFLSPTFSHKPQLHPFLDLRGHRFNNGKGAANFGMGVRYKSESLQKVFGCNLFYDLRRTNANLKQIGLGVEMFAKRFDLRSNGYLPVGNKIAPRRSPYYTYDDDYYLSMTCKQRALPGFDMEIATSLKKWDGSSEINFYGAIGPYYFHEHHHTPIIGGQARAGFTLLQEMLTMEVRISYDDTFHKIVQGLISLAVPFGPDRKKKKDLLREQALFTPVERKEIIVNNKKSCSSYYNW